jgi:serine O-acetyltransferase
MMDGSLFKVLKEDLIRLHCPSPGDVERGKVNVLKILSPRFLPVLILRVSSYLYKIPALRIISHVFTWLNVVVFGLESTPRCKIGSGLVIPHSSGIVIGAKAIGRNVTIFQGVTLGARVLDMSFKPETRPKIGDNVVIGAGSKVLGNVDVGDYVVIGANSVVLEDIPDSVVVGGVPAKIINEVM